MAKSTPPSKGTHSKGPNKQQDNSRTKTRNADRGNSNIVPDKKSLGPNNNMKKD